MRNQFRYILVSLTHTQNLALECLNDTWIIAHDPAALAAYPPAQRPAHLPMRRAAAWVRSGDPRAAALTQGEHDPLCLLMGSELLYWDEDGQGLFLPGIPGLIEVVLDDGHTPAVTLDGEGPPYHTISGVVAIRPAPYGVCAHLADPDLGFDLVILAGDPDALDGSSC